MKERKKQQQKSTTQLPALEAQLIEEQEKRLRVERQLGLQHRYQKAIIRCAQELLKSGKGKAEQTLRLEGALRALLTGASLCRVTLLKNIDDGDAGVSSRFITEVCAPGISGSAPELSNHYFSWIDAPMTLFQQLVVGGHLGGLLNEIFTDGPPLFPLSDARSVQFFPLKVNGKWWGTIIFCDCLNERRWSSAEIKLFAGAATLFGQALERWKEARTLRGDKTRLHDQVVQMLDAVDDAMLLIDVSNHQVVMANRAAEEMDQAIVGESCYSAIHHRETPCDGVDSPCSLKRALDTQQPVTVEHIHYDDDGQARYIEVHATPVCNDEGEVTQLIERFRDVTEQRTSALVLMESNAILKNSPAVAFVWQSRPGWPVEYVSDNVLALTGYSAEEFTSGTVRYSTIIHPNDVRLVVEEVDRYSQGMDYQDFCHLPYRIVTRQGEIKWVEDHSHIRRDKSGRITHYHGLVIDITERRRTEDAIKDIVAALATKGSERFMEVMVLQLANTLNADCTFIGELVSGERVRTLACTNDGQLSANFDYSLEGTPCETVMKGRVCSFSNGVAELFPEDRRLQPMAIEGYVGIPLHGTEDQGPFGLVVALYRRSIEDIGYAELMLQIFADQIAAGIKRTAAE